MFGSRLGFPAELRFILYGPSIHTHTAVARNHCVSWAFFVFFSRSLRLLRETAEITAAIAAAAAAMQGE